MCLFEEILEKMKNLGEKRGEKEKWVGVWLGRGVENFVVEPTKKFSSQNGEKTEGRKHGF